MLGIVKGIGQIYSVNDYFCDNPNEGDIYVDPETKRLFIYLKNDIHPSIKYSFFPVWNGKEKFVFKSSNYKTIDDVICMDINQMSQKINKELAEKIIAEQKKCNNSIPLNPVIGKNDNLFTKCIKGILIQEGYSLPDLVEMSYPKLDEKAIMVYYSSLVKTAFMRLNKWNVWLLNILHLGYKLTVLDENQTEIIAYEFPLNEFSVIDEDILDQFPCNDPLKRIVKILIYLKDITKEQFKEDDIDEYTINNLFTVINSDKIMSGQIFSRFILFANLSYRIDILSGDEIIYSLSE